MSLPFFSWSHTAANNATADSTVNWAEGMAPSAVNDSARAMMASTAAFRDDISGAITTAGTSTAYTVTSYQVFDTLAHLSGQMIAFVPHATNGATVTLNVDSLGAKPLRSSPATELLAGVLIQGTPYIATYNNSDGAFYLQGFYGNPYNVPLGSGMDYWLPTAPNSSFVFPIGQAISRTTYATLFAAMGTTFGVGDGSTTFNIPDKRGRVSAADDNMNGVAAGRLTSASGMGTGLLGQAGGAETETLTAAQIPTITSANAVQSITVSAGGGAAPVTTAGIGNSSVSNTTPATNNAPFAGSGGTWVGIASFAGDNAINVTSNNTSGAAHPNMQPTICCNYILRII